MLAAGLTLGPSTAAGCEPPEVTAAGFTTSVIGLIGLITWPMVVLVDWTAWADNASERQR